MADEIKTTIEKASVKQIVITDFADGSESNLQVEIYLASGNKITMFSNRTKFKFTALGNATADIDSKLLSLYIK